MISTTIFEAKTNLSQLIEEVQNGKTVTITSDSDNTPVARLEAIPLRRPMRLGLRETPGFKLSEAFFEPLPEEELDLWDGGGQ